MRIFGFKSIRFATLCFLLLTVRSVNAVQVSEEDGGVAVIVTWGDVNNTPANDVYIEAHGYVVRDKAERSFPFKMIHPGRYEAKIPPGVYDIFVSEGDSEPRCKRMLVVSGSTGVWTLKLETDTVFANR